MRSKIAIFAMVTFSLCAVLSSASAAGQDPLDEAVKRVGYWHIHRVYTAVNNGTTKTENDFDRCLDLRNPPPPAPIRLAGWACSNFKADKTPTAYHFRATCTFNNDGHMSSRTDMTLGRTPVYSQDTSTDWLKPDGTRAEWHVVVNGKLTGGCPAGMAPVNLSAAPSLPTTSLPMAHSH